MTSVQKMQTTLRNLRLALPVCLMSLTLVACGHSGPPPLARSLPVVPSKLMAPVPVPVLVKGQDARAALRLTGTALVEANARLSASSGWYESVRRDYAR